MPATLATVVAERSSRSAHWGRCRRAPGEEHWAHYLGPKRPPGSFGQPQIRDGWNGACERCGTPIPWGGRQQILGSAGHQQVYDTSSGRPEPGDLYWTDHSDVHACRYWDNCDGRHLHAVLPTGRTWDVDSRANNCGSPDDRLHRCWVRHGDPPAVHVDKDGLTCSAGGGSIAVEGYHGFLHHGAFTAG